MCQAKPISQPTEHPLCAGQAHQSTHCAPTVHRAEPVSPPTEHPLCAGLSPSVNLLSIYYVPGYGNKSGEDSILEDLTFQPDITRQTNVHPVGL